MREIKTTNGYTIKVDDCDYSILIKYNWYGLKKGNKIYADTIVKQKHIKMHRFLLNINNKKVHVDHIDGDGLNNTKINLRLCSNSQNQMNRGKQRNNTSGYKGVYFCKLNKRWKSQITKEGKTYSCGYHDTKEEAARAYDTKARELFGDYCKTNFTI